MVEYKGKIVLDFHRQSAIVRLMKTKKQDRKIIEVGEFNVPSGMIIVSDPCYDGSDQIKAKLGKWVGVVVRRSSDWFCSKPHDRTCMLLAFHESMRGKEKTFLAGRIPAGVCSKQVGFRSVDSGQMSVFDSDAFSEELYEECCEKSKGGGIISESGVVCDSGLGDGGYRMNIWENGGKTVAVTVKFLPLTGKHFD